MATERQIAANRANALKSTGPRSELGKDVCRRNALRHGLAAVAVVDPDHADAYDERLGAWEAEVRPQSERARWALGRAVAATFQIDGCDVDRRALAVQQQARARLSWDDDRRAEAADLAAGLARNPTKVARRLETSRHGCELLIDGWDRLGEALDADGGWGEAERSKALDLLGVPADLRSGRTAVDRAEGVDPTGYRRELVRRQAERLQGRIDNALAELDDLDRRHAEIGALLPLTGPGRLLARYERDAWRRFQRALKAAESTDPDPDDPPAPAPIRAARPEPEVVEVEVEDEDESEPEPIVAPESLPTTPEAIRATMAAIIDRAESAVTDAERRSSRLEMESFVALYGPELGIAMPPEVAALDQLNRHARRALAARSRRR